ncbi:MAG: hypothetical protein M3O09_00345 [Acidobacteriota bacterium]|nr:hypothetical protein [Acidobacteriota bacterium]
MIDTGMDDELHATSEVTSTLVPSVYVPIAVNTWEVPSEIVGDCGLMVIDTSAAGFTVKVTAAFTDPIAMPTLVVPAARVDANPAQGVA